MDWLIVMLLKSGDAITYPTSSSMNPLAAVRDHGQKAGLCFFDFTIIYQTYIAHLVN